MGKILQKKLNISKSIKDRKAKSNSHHVLKKLNILIFEWFQCSRFVREEASQKMHGRRIITLLNARRTIVRMPSAFTNNKLTYPPVNLLEVAA